MTMDTETSGWAVGWTAFAGVMMVILGVFHAIAGFVGILKDELYVLAGGYVLQLDASTWGWIHLVAGIVIFLAGVALFTGATWARVIGVILAVVSIVANFAWLPWYPLWAIVMITADVFVIWALTAHGRDIALR